MRAQSSRQAFKPAAPFMRSTSSPRYLPRVIITTNGVGGRPSSPGARLVARFCLRGGGIVALLRRTQRDEKARSNAIPRFRARRHRNCACVWRRDVSSLIVARGTLSSRSRRCHHRHRAPSSFVVARGAHSAGGACASRCRQARPRIIGGNINRYTTTSKCRAK